MGDWKTLDELQWTLNCQVCQQQYHVLTVLHVSFTVTKQSLHYHFQKRYSMVLADYKQFLFRLQQQSIGSSRASLLGYSTALLDGSFQLFREAQCLQPGSQSTRLGLLDPDDVASKFLEMWTWIITTAIKPSNLTHDNHISQSLFF